VGQVEPLSPAGSYDAFGILVKLPNGDVVSIYRHGTTHASDRGQIMLRRQSPERPWSDPVVLFDDPVMDSRNVAGGLLPSGDLLVFWNTWDYVKHLPGTLHYSRSSDGGHTWSVPVIVPGRESAYGPIVSLPGRLALSTAKTISGTVHVYMQFSTDDGLTWKQSSQVPVSDYEVAYLSLGHNEILGFARNQKRRSLLRLYSGDVGKSWTVSSTNLVAQNGNEADWELVSPWMVKPLPNDPAVQLWYAERVAKTVDGARSEIGILRAVAFAPASAISSPHCLPQPQSMFQTTVYDFGYPSIIFLPNNAYRTQFYNSYAGLQLLDGVNSKDSTAMTFVRKLGRLPLVQTRCSL
jgi:hypothetical protein